MTNIICRVDPGLGLQHVDYYDNNQLLNSEAIPYSELCNYLIAACYQENCFNLHLFGNWKFLEGLIQGISAEEQTKYNANKILLEIN